MEEIIFEVQGSAPEPYRVTFIKESDTKLLAFCTCPAGKNGQYCKHRFNILNGLEDNISSPNKHQVTTVVSWLVGTSLEGALFERNKLEKELENAKKRLARVMVHG